MNIKQLYVDNFRGFKKTTIPIQNVNFLVGENSTGKSSILSLVKILSGHSFLWYGSFEADEELGGFEDIVSINSNNRKEFIVGLHATPGENSEESNANYFSLIITYTKRNEKILPSRVTYGSSGKYLIINFKQNNVTYKLEKNTQDAFSGTHFENAISLHSGKVLGFIRLQNIDEWPQSEIPIGFAVEMVNRELFNRNREQDTFKRLTFFSQNLIWTAPIREKPKRVYDNLKPGFSPEGSHTPYLINNMLKKNNEASKHLNQSISKFGIESNLFSSISSRRFGNTQNAPFEININLTDTPINILNVGYGVSQILPVVMESLTREEQSIFCIQQPEVHLHPKAQAALGTFFHKLSILENKDFIIETHSDFIIDRFRLAKSKVAHLNNSSKSQVLFFERKDNQNTVTSIDIEDNGKYAESQPDSYKEFFLREQLAILDI